MKGPTRERGNCVHNLPPNDCTKCVAYAAAAGEEIRRAMRQLKAGLQIAQQAYPDAEIYIEEACFTLMSGPPHDGERDVQRARQLLSLGEIKGVGTGSW